MTVRIRKIRLGDKVKDSITDFQGTVVAIAHWLHGCTQCAVQPKELKDGKIIESEWIDEPQLQLIKVTEKKKSEPNYGGIRSYPTK